MKRKATEKEKKYLRELVGENGTKAHCLAIIWDDLDSDSITSADAKSSFRLAAILSMRALRKRESRGVPG